MIRANAGPNLRRLELFDRYQGPPLESDEVSLAYRLRFQATDSPIPEEEHRSPRSQAVSEALARDVDGRIRSGS